MIKDLERKRGRGGRRAKTLSLYKLFRRIEAPFSPSLSPIPWAGACMGWLAFLASSGVYYGTQHTKGLD